MKQDILRVAIYSRKSKFTGKGNPSQTRLKNVKNIAATCCTRKKNASTSPSMKTKGIREKIFSVPP